MQTSFTDTHDSPPIPDGNDSFAPRSTHHGEATPRGVSARPSLARDVPAPDRCQAVGGARAANSGRCGEGKSKASGGSLGTRTEMSGRGNDGGSARTKAPARWIRVQIGQWSSARSCRSVGSGGVTCAAFDASAPATVDLSADIGTARSRCTWPNVSASWNTSANSARYEPHFDRERNQSIRRRACASHIGSRPIPASRCRNISNNVTLRQLAAADSSIAPFGFISRVAKNPQWRERASTRAATDAACIRVFEGKPGQRPSRIQVAARLPTRSRSPISPANTGNTPMPRTTLASRTRNPSQSSP